MGCVISRSRFRWPNRRVPYVINRTDFPLRSDERRIINEAIGYWNSTTVMRLVRRRRTESDFVEFREGTACGSRVGRQGGAQSINCDLDSGNFGRGSVIHEIGHAIALWHEHTREDRDDFVDINFNNIQQNRRHNFEKHISDGTDIGPYDYGSIMHYGRRAFAVDRVQDTITPTNPPTAAIGQINGLSQFDRWTIQQIYRVYNWFVSFSGTSRWTDVNTSSYRLEDFAVGSFDRSGTCDIFRANGRSWYISAGARGRWKKINTSGYKLNKLALADFTGNGKSDVFRATGGKWYISEDGTGRWRRLNTSSYRLDQLAFADFTGNGKSDVFRANGREWYISEDGKGRWRRLNTSSYRLDQLAFADFTGNGKSDVFRASGREWFISEDGTGRWRRLNTSRVRLKNLMFGDFNGDGKTDVFRIGFF